MLLRLGEIEVVCFGLRSPCVASSTMVYDEPSGQARRTQRGKEGERERGRILHGIRVAGSSSLNNLRLL